MGKIKIEQPHVERRDIIIIMLCHISAYSGTSGSHLLIQKRIFNGEQEKECLLVG